VQRIGDRLAVLAQSSLPRSQSILIGMKAPRTSCLILAFALLSFAVPSLAHAGDGSFDKFCRTWMKKLKDRESFNQKKATVENRNGKFVMEYIGYTRKPLSCTASRGRGDALIGALVYDEIRYQKTGAKRASVAKSRPVVVKRAPVTEIFSHDGKEWLY